MDAEAEVDQFEQMQRLLECNKSQFLCRHTSSRWRSQVGHFNFDLTQQSPMNTLVTRTRGVHESDGPAGLVGSRFCRILAGRVGSALRIF